MIAQEDFNEYCETTGMDAELKAQFIGIANAEGINLGRKKEWEPRFRQMLQRVGVRIDKRGRRDLLGR